MSRFRIPLLAGSATALAALGLALIFWPSADRPSTSSSIGGHTASSSTPSPSPSSSSSADAGHEHHEHHDHGDPETLRAQHQLVTRFAQSFAAEGPQKDWLAGLEPYVTQDLLEGFRYTDPRLRLTGKVGKVVSVAELEGVFTVAYVDGNRISCTLAADGSGSWRVGKVEPIEAPAPSGHDL